MNEQKITTRCPNCGHQTLFIGSGGHLTCSWLECSRPSIDMFFRELNNELEKLKTIMAEKVQSHVAVMDAIEHMRGYFKS